MDIYHIWCNLKEGIMDTEFSSSVEKYCDHLMDNGQLVRHRITRKKLGLGPAELPDFHIMLEFDNLTQMDDAFNNVASRQGDVENFHHAVNSKVKNVKFALYRDFPDPVRVLGKEKF